MQSKRCSKCRESKHVSSFGRDRSCRDGLARQCKECRRAYYDAHRDEDAARCRAYREANRDKLRAKDRAYREAHWDEVSAMLRKRAVETQSASREIATRNGEPWTPAEDRVVLATDGTLLEIALTLGRTMSSVVDRRKRLRRKAVTA